jgi:hypothetical protein
MDSGQAQSYVNWIIVRDFLRSYVRSKGEYVAYVGTPTWNLIIVYLS